MHDPSPPQGGEAGRRDLDPGLYLVSTPIGNLQDITLRALSVLREADLIAAEDTRKTRVLLTSHGISTPMVSYRDANKERQAPRLLDRMLGGESVALVSDAGTANGRHAEGRVGPLGHGSVDRPLQEP